MNFLVTGGGGFLGLYIVEQLLAEGHQVRVFCRGHYPALQRPGVSVFQGDIRDANAVNTACRGIQAVFHVAAVPGIWGRWKTYHEINTLGTLNVIRGCRDQGVERLIYTSSPSVVFDGKDHVEADESLPYPSRWLCHYPHSKALAEQAVLEADSADAFRTTALRPHLIWGPRDNHLIPRLISKAVKGQLRRVGDGTNVVSVSYVENVAAAHLQAEKALRTSSVPAGKPYFINEPESVNLWNWVDELLMRAGLNPIRRKISSGAATRVGAIFELLYKGFRISAEPPMTRFVAAQLAGSHSYSIAAAQRDFQYQPICTMEEGLKRMQPDLDRLAGRNS